MKANQVMLMDLLGTKNAQYVIPIFQRAYSWTEGQCAALWNDAVAVQRSGRQHYAGVVLLRHEGVSCNVERIAVVDGQQRIATLVLLLAAARDFCLEDDPSLAQQISSEYLNVCVDGNTVPKITLSRFDRLTMEALLSGGQLPDEDEISELMVDAYQLFLDRFRRSGVSVEDVVQGLKQFTVVEAELEGEDKPQLVFESLNAKGSPLRVSDLVRNLLMTRMGQDEQERMFEVYWRPMEAVFDELEMEARSKTKNVIGKPPERRRANVEGIIFDAALHAWAIRNMRGVTMHNRTDLYGAYKNYLLQLPESSLQGFVESVSTSCLLFAKNHNGFIAKKHIEWVMGKPEGFGM